MAARAGKEGLGCPCLLHSVNGPSEDLTWGSTADEFASLQARVEVSTTGTSFLNHAKEPRSGRMRHLGGGVETAHSDRCTVVISMAVGRGESCHCPIVPALKVPGGCSPPLEQL